MGNDEKKFDNVKVAVLPSAGQPASGRARFSIYVDAPKQTWAQAGAAEIGDALSTLPNYAQVDLMPVGQAASGTFFSVLEIEVPGDLGRLKQIEELAKGKIKELKGRAVSKDGLQAADNASGASATPASLVDMSEQLKPHGIALG